MHDCSTVDAHECVPEIDRASSGGECNTADKYAIFAITSRKPLPLAVQGLPPPENASKTSRSPSASPLAPDENRKTKCFKTWWNEETEGLKSGNTEASGRKRK